VPLSEEELRLLEQMERALVEEDPKLASTLRGTTLRSAARRRAIAAGACFLIGIVVLMTGVISEHAPVGIAGFVIMLASATYGLTQLRGQRRGATSTTAHPSTGNGNGAGGFTLIHGSGGRSRRKSRSSGSSGSFMDRIEERWRRRRDQGL
jgi:hypothetical protein